MRFDPCRHACGPSRRVSQGVFECGSMRNGGEKSINIKDFWELSKKRWSGDSISTEAQKPVLYQNLQKAVAEKGVDELLNIAMWMCD